MGYSRHHTQAIGTAVLLLKVTMKKKMKLTYRIGIISKLQIEAVIIACLTWVHIALSVGLRAGVGASTERFALAWCVPGALLVN